MPGAGDLLVGLRPRCGRSRSTSVGARVDDLRSELDEPLVPELERRELALGDPRAARRLQQGVALPQHPVVVGEHAGEPRRQLHEQLVEEPAPPRRLAADQREIFGGEQHGRDVAGQFARLHRDPIDLGAVRAGAVELHLERAPRGRRARAARGRSPRPPRCGSAPDRSRPGATPRVLEVADRLDEVGLALAVDPTNRFGPGTSATSAVS